MREGRITERRREEEREKWIEGGSEREKEGVSE